MSVEEQLSTEFDTFEEFKNSDKYNDYYDSLLKDYPEMFKQQIELSLYSWFNMEIEPLICKRLGREYKSIEDEKIEKPEKINGECKGVDVLSAVDWELKYGDLKPIKGTEELKLITEDDIEKIA